jgi:hypothetical protein
MRFFILFTLYGLVSHGQTETAKIPSEQLEYRHILPDQSYEQQLTKIRSKRLYFKSNNIDLATCKAYFLNDFEYSIFPYWVGTIWDYNGYTDRPGKDKLIACGYFVSTPLKHMGFNWNRYKLAQMYSKNIAETICNDVVKYTDKAEMLKTIEAGENNLYIVGLDSHVGMILKSDSGLWFVHSNYYELKGPDKEIASKSLALAASGTYYVGAFSSNENIKKWLNGSLFITE